MPPPAAASDYSFVWEVVKIIFTAAISVALSGFWVSRWKARLDHAEKRIDDLYNEIKSIADDATEYWTLDQQNEKVAVLEAKVSAGIMRIAQLRVVLCEMVPSLDTESLVSAEASFLREATGGSFGVHNRTASTAQAASVQLAGSALMVTLRKIRLGSYRRKWFLPKI